MYNVRLDPETFLTERAKGRHLPNCGLPADYLPFQDWQGLVGLLSPPGQELNGVRGNSFRSCVLTVLTVFYFFYFWGGFLFMFCLFFIRGRARVLVLLFNPLILTLNRSMIKSNSNCELCNSLARGRR